METDRSSNNNLEVPVASAVVAAVQQEGEWTWTGQEWAWIAKQQRPPSHDSCKVAAATVTSSAAGADGFIRQVLHDGQTFYFPQRIVRRVDVADDAYSTAGYVIHWMGFDRETDFSVEPAEKVENEPAFRAVLLRYREEVQASEEQAAWLRLAVRARQGSTVSMQPGGRYSTSGVRLPTF